MSTAFQAISVVGGVVPPSLLGRIQFGEVNDPRSLDPASYHLMGIETVRDASSRSWGYLRTAWQSWRELDAKRRPDGQGAGTGDARQKWLLILLREFGYGQVPATGGGLQAADTTYPISHRWESVPIHLLGPGVELDKRSPGVEGAAKRAPQTMVQEFLNRESDYLWAILSNGLKLRLLRDSTALAGSAYIEFDLETIFDSDLYPEFQILWQLCHQSRLDKRGGAEASPADCWLESWRAESVDAGARALDRLGVGVEKALDYLGTGFLRHPENGWLVDALHTGELSPRDFHKALLRTAYRLLFCFVVEDRNALLVPDAPVGSRDRYAKYFSTQRLRRLSRNRDGGPHPDLWRTQKLVLSALGGDGLEALGLPALGGLFDPDSRARKLAHQPHEDLLLGAELANQDFLKAIRRLSWVLGKGDRLQPVDYRHLGAEELGSVYESLLELIPRIDTETRSFELVRLAGNERKVTGSYYTPPSLVSALLDTALDPLLDDAVNGGTDAADRETRLLALTVCDPASGSGGFLVAAARRIARRLAEVRAGENEPTPAEIQHALHDVVERCIYGVDMNDLAAELAKVSLWLEAMEPGKPLGFLDARIKIGNSLLGTTPALLAGGVPDEAFGVLEGDDKKYAAEVKKRNKAENSKKADKLFGSLGQETFSFGSTTPGVAKLIGQRQELVKPVSTAAEARSRAKAYEAFDHSADMEQQRLHADAWSAAFVWPLHAAAAEPPTSSIVRQLADAGESAGYTDTVATIRQLAQEYRFFHWHLEFPEIFGDPESDASGPEGWPGGFSCLLGNPPWEQVQLDPTEYFITRAPEIALESRKDLRDALISDLRKTDPLTFAEYERDKRYIDCTKKFFHSSKRFPLSSFGRLNTYSLFAESFLSLISPSGRSGIIVPTGIATDSFNQYFFSALVQSERLHSLYDFENSLPYFDQVHRSYKFCLLTVNGRKRLASSSRFAFFLSDPMDISAVDFEMTPKDIQLINPNTGTLPIFRARIDAEITRDAYRRFPVLVNDSGVEPINPWAVVLKLMVILNTDASLLKTANQIDQEYVWKSIGNRFVAIDRDDDELVPVFEGKMINQFDHRWASFEGLQISDSPVIFKVKKDYEVTPRYWFPKSVLLSRVPDFWQHSWFLGWRNTARTTDARTVISSMVFDAAATGGFPAMFPAGGARDAIFLSGMLNSMAFDYLARQKVGGTDLRFFVMKQCPVISPALADRKVPYLGNTPREWALPRLVELLYTSTSAGALARDVDDTGEPFLFDEHRRRMIVAELDALFFHLYSFDREDVVHVLDSFRSINRSELSEFSEFRTKRVTLEVFDAMQVAIDNNETYATRITPEPGNGPRHSAKEVSA